MVKTGGAAASAEAGERSRNGAQAKAGAGCPINLDPHRAIVFPNRLRELRRAAGFPTLLSLAARIPEIPYIRLSKLERGEVFARADELQRIAAHLGTTPQSLLIDIEDPVFDLGTWAGDHHEARATDRKAEEFAVILAAALRRKRAGEPGLTMAKLADDYGLPTVIISRLENAFKPVERWNMATQTALCRLFGVPDLAALRRELTRLHQAGELDALIRAVIDPEGRRARSRERLAELRAQLALPAPPEPRGGAPAPTPAAAETSPARLLPVFGSALADGLVAMTACERTIEAPRGVGPRAYGLQVIRATLGPGLPARATVVADPDRYPWPGGLAVMQEGEACRLIAVMLDRNGSLVGFSEHPKREFAIDGMDPKRFAAVVGATFE